MTAMKAFMAMKQQSSSGQDDGRRQGLAALGSKVMKSKAEAMKEANKSGKAGSPPKAMKAMKAKREEIQQGWCPAEGCGKTCDEVQGDEVK